VQWKEQDQPSKRLITTYNCWAFFPSTPGKV
jgi:hypothetical protein